MGAAMGISVADASQAVRSAASRRAAAHACSSESPPTVLDRARHAHDLTIPCPDVGPMTYWEEPGVGHWPYKPWLFGLYT